MTYVGNKEGNEIWRDNRTGQFYIDDGWDVQRVGTAGFVPHPVDREHLKELTTKYNPANLPWVDFLLATFEGRTDQLWRNFFDKYQVGPKPNEPTWGKGIRKARWSQYGEQLEQWEAKKAQLEPEFKKEQEMWKAKRAKYDKEHAEKQAASAGNALLQRALSGGVVIVQQAPPVPAGQQQYKAVVPSNLRAGDTFTVGLCDLCACRSSDCGF